MSLLHGPAGSPHTTGGSEDDVDVIVVGAGPSGLMTANLLGLYGLRVAVVEAGPALIDFPRGVGMDDETLRTFQTVKLAEEVLPHTIPHQLLAFVDSRQRDLARMSPPAAEFGWPRRNGFVQPLADAVLSKGLERFEKVRVRWSSTVTGFRQDDDGVTVDISGATGESRLRGSFVVGADGGRSAVRKALGLRFEGSSSSENWLVIDIRNDPLGRPGAYVCADPRRPYVSISIPHGIRRFEFMLRSDESEALAVSDNFVADLLAPLIPSSAHVDIIRRRVYTHHSRIATRFRSERVFLVGDAAHVMPVWQGQGYNSGIRDALNLSWKLAMVVGGNAGDRLLDSYESERRSHVVAMVQLSTMVGRMVSITNRSAASARDLFFRAIGAVPRAKRYIVTMKFKPMPTMTVGALTHCGCESKPTPVGKLFIQPTVATRADESIKLDDALGPWISILVWNNDPLAILDPDAQLRLSAVGAKLVAVRPNTQLRWNQGVADESVLVVGDLDGSLKRWFDARGESVVLLRPDHIVGGASPAHGASEMVRAFLDVIGAPAVSCAALSTLHATVPTKENI